MATDVQEPSGLQIHPMDQFVTKPLFGGDTVHMVTITNATLWMVLAVIVIAIVFVFGSNRKAIVPGRLQSVGEVLYSFGRNMVEETAGKGALPFFPYIMTLFMFILFSNLLGLLPYSFAPTAQISITATMAISVFILVTVLGFVKNGLGFLKLFWVSSAPMALRPVLAIIELISFLIRPLSHSVRLAGNIMAGHAVIKVFAGFAGVMGVFAVVPILSISAIYALETLVAVLQAYVFAILTCVYLHDALHPGH